MKVGILGSGEVAKSLAKGFLKTGHEVQFGSRDQKNEKLENWLKEEKLSAVIGTFKDAAAFGEIVVLAVMGNAVEDVINQAGKEEFAGKIVIDVTNPLEITPNQPPKLSTKHTSNGEFVQSLLADSQVVKTFNIIGNTMFYQPKFEEGDPDMLLCGNNDDAKKKVEGILHDFGWKNVTDIGGIDESHYMEALCILWVVYALKHGNWHVAFKMVQK
jgi:predicted dinucleotide-binding enzyme